MRRQKGFTLIELLIVVAIIGIIAAIAIPNLLNAINRGRQKRTMGDIRTLATAIEAYTVDFGFYPKGAVTDVQVDAALVNFLVPTFLRKLPARDGWNNPIRYSGLANGQSYTFWSGAKNGNSGIDYTAPGGPKTDFASDIIYSVGVFIQWPEGMQVN